MPPSTISLLGPSYRTCWEYPNPFQRCLVLCGCLDWDLVVVEVDWGGVDRDHCVYGTAELELFVVNHEIIVVDTKKAFGQDEVLVVGALIFDGILCGIASSVGAHCAEMQVPGCWKNLTVSLASCFPACRSCE